MRYYYKVFKFENGAKKVDLSPFCQVPIFIEDKLDEELDRGQITLSYMPISTRRAIPPKTKIRIERYTSAGNLNDNLDYVDGDNNILQPQKSWDFVVDKDEVEEYPGLQDKCTHRIHLIEPSVICQGMHVDNIALTYELQDVNLNYKTIVDDTITVDGAGQITVQPQGYTRGERQTDNIRWSISVGSFTFFDFFRNSYFYRWDDSSVNSIKNLKLNQSATQSHEISFTIPKLICQGATSTGDWSQVAIDLFEMNTITTVKEVKYRNGQPIQTTTIVTKESGATSIPSNNDDRWYSDGTNASLRYVNDWNGSPYVNQFQRSLSNLPAISKADSSYSDKTVTFSTTQLSNAEIIDGYAFQYVIECRANPINESGLIMFYEKTAMTISWNDGYTGAGISSRSYTTANEPVQASTVFVSTTLNVLGQEGIQENEGGAFLMKGKKYNCYDLLRRALLTIDTQLIDNTTTGLDELDNEGQPQPSINYPIIVSERWINRLKTATMYETIFEGKNLWEVLIQIGYYLHAIPYLEFATDGTDRFVLNFRQLGDTRVKQDSSTKCTIFNSRNLDEYFTQYDSYVTNLFSPQNVVEEWVCCKTSDSSYLVSNDTAEIQVSRPISEIIEFDITYNGVTQDALQYVFEQSVYQVLTSDNPTKIRPAKGNSLYYTFGTNSITGLSYVAPSASSGTFAASLQYIMGQLFAGTSNWVGVGNVKYNDIVFHVKYRTQDSLRVSQVRPDISNFVKNSSYEKYPHHEQFYGQQDKIVDSERFSANLYGKLIRVGNALYQCNEYAKNVWDEKETGDLVLINNEPYYVTAIDNEFYPDMILQKVTYTKNFNQLSQIVTIPSEPRFYEVSERSQIRREVRIMEFLELSTVNPYDGQAVKARQLKEQIKRDMQPPASPKFMTSSTMVEFIKGVIFGDTTANYVHPNFAYTKFKADTKRQHRGSNGQYVANDVLFPSSDINRADPNNITPQQPKSYAENIVTLLHFPLHDGIVFEWDMVDNFSAGDFVDTSVSSLNNADSAYFAQQPVRYVDILGRADLFEFMLINKTSWNQNDVQALPKANTIPSSSTMQTPTGLSIALDKDNREMLSFNYQINLLHKANEGDDDFVTFPNLFGNKEIPLDNNKNPIYPRALRMCLLNQAQSLFNENIDLSGANIIADNLDYTLTDIGNCVELTITPPTTINDGYDPSTYLSFVQAIVLYQYGEDSVVTDDGTIRGSRYAYIVKNVNRLDDNNKLQNWYIYPVFNN